MARPAVVLICILMLTAVCTQISWAENNDKTINNIAGSPKNSSLNEAELTSNTTADVSPDTKSNLSSQRAQNTTAVGTLNETETALRMNKVLRTGLRKTRSPEVLAGHIDSYNSTGSIEKNSQSKPAFNLSQRRGSVFKFTANTDSYTPFFSANQYTRTKPTYQAPDNLSTREVYNTSGYPALMLANSIP